MVNSGDVAKSSVKGWVELEWATGSLEFDGERERIWHYTQMWDQPSLPFNPSQKNTHTLSNLYLSISLSLLLSWFNIIFVITNPSFNVDLWERFEDKLAGRSQARGSRVKWVVRKPTWFFVFNRNPSISCCLAYLNTFIREWFRVFRKCPERQLLETRPKLCRLWEMTNMTLSVVLLD